MTGAENLRISKHTASIRLGYHVHALGLPFLIIGREMKAYKKGKFRGY